MSVRCKDRLHAKAATWWALNRPGAQQPCADPEPLGTGNDRAGRETSDNNRQRSATLHDDLKNHLDHHPAPRGYDAEEIFVFA